MPRRKDIWRCGLIQHAGASIWDGASGQEPIVWFPEEPDFQFLADPFGLWVDHHLHVWAEHYDYRSRHGTIQRLVFDQHFNLVDRGPSLKEPWHLSYPQIFEADGETWMLPEAHRSGGLTLYRAHGGLDQWKAECRIELDAVPVDASIVRHEGRWWLFYSPATSKFTKIAHLHVAWADQLCGPWTSHSANPVRIDPRSSRPGGAPVVKHGRILLPVQDCSVTYGGAIRSLVVDRVNDREFHASASDPLIFPQPFGAYGEGMHTINGCGPVTLFDVKRIDRSMRGLALDVKRMLGAGR